MTVPAMKFVCHTEPLHDYGDGNRYFSMNVSIAFDVNANIDEAAVAAYLNPENWRISRGFFTRIDNANNVKAAVEGTLVAGTVPEPAADEAAKAMLDHLLAKNDLALFRLNDVTEVQESTPRWYTALLQFATGAARVSHALEITRVFKIAAGELTNIVKVIGAPEIEWTDSTRATPKPINDGDAFPEVNGHYTWPYNGVTADALTNGASTTRTGRNGFVDLTTGWVMPDAGFKVRAADVNVALESRGADLFDATGHLLDALVQVPSDEQTPAMEALPWLIADDVGVAGLFSQIRKRLSGGTLTEAELDAIGTAIDRGVDPSKPEVDAAWRVVVEAVLGVSFAKDRFAAASLRDALRDPARFRRLIAEMWIGAAAAHVDAAIVERFQAMKPKVLDALATVPADSHHRQVARDERKKIIARAASAGATSAEDEREQVVAAIVERVMARWVSLAAHPRITHAEAAFRTKLRERAQSAAAAVVHGNPARPQLEALDEDGLAIQVSPVAAADAADDLMRRISGFGVLLRSGADKKWTCLNMARFSDDMARPPAIVPSRLQYRNGVRQSYLVYENEPLVAASPLGEPNLYELEATNRDDDDLPAPVLAYRNAYAKGSDWTLPPLVYGRTYQVAAFAIGNGGALPKEVAAKPSGDFVPWELKTLTSDALAQSWDVEYRRRRPVGTCRLGTAKSGPAQQTFENLGLPAIPAAVHPIARSLDAPKVLEANGEPALTTPAASLLLLHRESPVRGSFTFDVRPPAIDMPVWDRWVGRKPADAARNAAVWSEYLKTANSRDPNQPHPVAVDLSVDDPAVTEIHVHLVRRWSRGGAPAEQWRKVDIPFVLAGNQGLDLARHKAFRVKVVAGLAIDVTVAAAERLVTITIPEKEVWRIAVHAAVPTTEAVRFENSVEWFDTTGSMNPPANVKLAQPLELDVEVIPTQQPISADELHAALQLTSANGKLLVKLDRARLGATAPWIHDVEVLLQQWRWDGRPLAVPEGQGLRDGFFERLAAGAPAGTFDSTLPQSDPMLVEAVLFADRDSADRLEIPSFVEAIDKTKSQWTLHERDLSLLKGALYFRAAVRARSRYAPITDIAIESRSATTSGAAEAWQRAVVPCRWNEPVPPPAVKLVLPLTRPAATTRNAGVLVVLDEPWFDIGGLGERFTAEVMTAAVPGTETTLPEIGPDPILTLAPLQLRPDTSFARAAGPVGFTFDEPGVSAPLFARSSFIVEPSSVVVDGESRDLAWTMVKLRFRRVLERESFGDAAGRMADRQSEATVPFWTQLLPSAVAFDCTDGTTKTSVRVDELRAISRGNSLVFQHGSTAVTPMPVQVDSLSRSRFTLYVLLTRRWTDAGGQRSESYVALLDLATNVALPAALPPGEYFVRLIEVQSHVKTPAIAAKDLWQTLFDDDAIPGKLPVDGYDPTINASARIVRMSDGIKVI